VRELLPGLHHWTAQHPSIGMRVSSFLVVPAAVVVDPLLPEDGGAAAIEALVRPTQVVLTSGNHRRHAAEVSAHFGGLPIRCSAAGDERLGGALPIDRYADGEELAPGVTAHEVGAISADEYALHVAVGHGALAVCDGVVNYGGLRFVPDHLIGDDPEGVKAGLREAFTRLLDLEWDTLLPAHGEPLVGGAKAALRAFVEA
jgi:hypothetical protein